LRSFSHENSHETKHIMTRFRSQFRKQISLLLVVLYFLGSAFETHARDERLGFSLDGNGAVMATLFRNTPYCGVIGLLRPATSSIVGTQITIETFTPISSCTPPPNEEIARSVTPANYAANIGRLPDGVYLVTWNHYAEDSISGIRIPGGSAQSTLTIRAGATVAENGVPTLSVLHFFVFGTFIVAVGLNAARRRNPFAH
jgi:hypothetical protein